LLGNLPAFVDDLIQAMRHEAGLPGKSELPTTSSLAVELGRQRQEYGFELAIASLSFGVVSDSTGELGGRYGLSFEAADYQQFNHCLDVAVAAAITEYSKLVSEGRERDEALRLGFLAHELRNALSSARLAADVLRSGHGAIQGLTGDVLDRNLRRMHALLAQTMLAAQLQASAPLTLAPVNLNRLLSDVKSSAVLERNITVAVQVDAHLQIQADENALLSALGNLLQNAIKFSHSGARVEVRAARVEDQVSIEVEDECGGLPQGSQERLFQPFVHGSGKRNTGLGLPIAREAVLAQGGELKVRDLPGKGCIFSIHLRSAP
jgi:signal transduction histidine kinase